VSIWHICDSTVHDVLYREGLKHKSRIVQLTDQLCLYTCCWREVQLDVKALT